MGDIIFEEIDKALGQEIVKYWGEWARDCLHFGEGCYSLAALYEGLPIGFISVCPSQFPQPLEVFTDAYIDDIEVDESFRRHGIARGLLARTEAWAKAYGYHQLRAWSSDDKKEAIALWYALDYALCPAVMRGESVREEFKGRPVYGFYAAKVL